jgi:hypothetical protein
LLKAACPDWRYQLIRSILFESFPEQNTGTGFTASFYASIAKSLPQTLLQLRRHLLPGDETSRNSCRELSAWNTRGSAGNEAVPVSLKTGRKESQMVDSHRSLESHRKFSFHRTRHWLHFLLSAGFALLLAGCGSGGAGILPLLPTSLQARYSSAVADARILKSSEISCDLTPISNYNGKLIWENGVVGSRVLVATVIGDAGKYYLCTDPAGCTGDTCREGGNCSTYHWDSWVTVAPELQNFRAPTTPSLLRVVQLLGLPPSYATVGSAREAKYVLELWVKPEDLFRPCPDSEISDTVCEMGFPIDPFRMLDRNNKILATEGLPVPVFETYTSWFSNRTRNVYTATPDSEAYPWTRVGYTYDWGSPNHVGLSEFVVHGKKEDGSTISVGIHSVRTIKEYFRR